MHTYGVQPLQFALQLLGHFVDLAQVFEVALHPIDLVDIAPLLQCIHGLLGVLLLHAEEVHLGRLVLQEMGHDAEANAGGASDDNINLERNKRVSALASSRQNLRRTGREVNGKEGQREGERWTRNAGRAGVAHLAGQVRNVGVGVELVTGDQRRHFADWSWVDGADGGRLLVE